MGRFNHTTGDRDYPTYFGLSGLALSRMIGFAAGAGFVSIEGATRVCCFTPVLNSPSSPPYARSFSSVTIKESWVACLLSHHS